MNAAKFGLPAGSHVDVFASRSNSRPVLLQLQTLDVLDPKRREFIAQNEFPWPLPAAKIRHWYEDVCSRHPLPDGCLWLLCSEESHYFYFAPAQTISPCVAP